MYLYVIHTYIYTILYIYVCVLYVELMLFLFVVERSMDAALAGNQQINNAPKNYELACTTAYTLYS